jgi:hypothetical protein
MSLSMAVGIGTLELMVMFLSGEVGIDTLESIKMSLSVEVDIGTLKSMVTSLVGEVDIGTSRADDDVPATYNGQYTYEDDINLPPDTMPASSSRHILQKHHPRPVSRHQGENSSKTSV